MYGLVAIIKKRLGLTPSLSTILQILSVTVFEKTPLPQALTATDIVEKTDEHNNQLMLFNV